MTFESGLLSVLWERAWVVRLHALSLTEPSYQSYVSNFLFNVNVSVSVYVPKEVRDVSAL